MEMKKQNMYLIRKYVCVRIYAASETQHRHSIHHLQIGSGTFFGILGVYIYEHFHFSACMQEHNYRTADAQVRIACRPRLKFHLPKIIFHEFNIAAVIYTHLDTVQTGVYI